MVERFLGDKIALHAGDCLTVLPTLAENSIDSCCCDPPYHLTSIVQRFGDEGAAPPRFRTGAYGGGVKEANGGTGAAFARMSRGFMGKVWDGGDIAFRPETWAAVYRVLKPGAHLVAFGGTRTFHRLACAIEDAGFEIRDTVSWLYGSGFPKSHDVSKGIDRAAGAARRTYGSKRIDDSAIYSNTGALRCDVCGNSRNGTSCSCPQSLPATDAAREWQGWGTALKPACELIVLARKPLSEPTIAANVLRWGTGAINVDGCRVNLATDEDAEKLKARSGGTGEKFGRGIYQDGMNNDGQGWDNTKGRWPANLLHDGCDEVVAAFPDTKTGTIDPTRHVHKNGKGTALSGSADGSLNNYLPHQFHEGDSGSAARFFYTAKADADDRLGSKHPTIKPVDLMQWLVRLITAPKGIVLDCFAGTGTLGEAAWREGMRAVLIEAEPEYQADIRRRMALVLAGPDERQRESIKAKNLPRDDGPLFAAQQGAPAPSESWAEMWAKPFDFSQEPRE